MSLGECEENSYGCGKFRPKFIQKLGNVKWALFWLCLIAAVQGLIVNGLVSVVITTIEKRFGLSSTQTGIVAGSYDMSSFVCLIPVSYFGGRSTSSKPLYLGIGTVLMGLGSLVFALPHFLASTYYSATLDDVSTCPRNSSGSFEIVEAENLEWSLWFFLIGQFILGAGASPLYTLGVTYIDDNVSRKASAMYLGIFYCMAVIGPALGFVIGGQSLLLHTDFLTVDSTELGITNESNAWVGAWWLGFVGSAAVCLILAIPFFGFPKMIPGSSELNKDTIDRDNINNVQAFTKLRELPKALVVLLKNNTFVLICLASALESGTVGGLAAFASKHIENQFNLSATMASIIVGATTITAGAGGTFLGGYIVKKFKMHCFSALKMCVIVTLLAAICTTSFLFWCPNLNFAGVTSSYAKDNDPQGILKQSSAFDIPQHFSFLEAPCNKDCNCDPMNYDPVCGMDNVMYFNPCFAGCKQMTFDDSVKYYNDCSCIQNYTEAQTYEAVNKKCDTDCGNLPYFAVGKFILLLFTLLAVMPSLTATLRCVYEDMRSLALGVKWLTIRALGTVPLPIIFGSIIDTTCILWQQEGDAGACYLYNNEDMKNYMLILTSAFKSCSMLLYAGALFCYYRRINATRKEDTAFSEDIATTEDLKG